MGNRAFPELGSDIMQEIYLTAIKRYPNEACGFLVRTTGEKYRFMEARNVSENPENTFVMHADDIIAAEDAGDVLPSGTPTLTNQLMRQMPTAPDARQRKFRG